MPYTIARYAGYCAGVRKAMETAEEAAREAKERGVSCCSLGELIHNPDAVLSLKEKGVLPIQRVEEAEAGGMILLRSHGVAPEVEEACRQRGLHLHLCPGAARDREGKRGKGRARHSGGGKGPS